MSAARLPAGLVSCLLAATTLVLAQGFVAPPVRAAQRAAPPTSDPSAPGHVSARELPDGAVPLTDAEGDFIIGPTHDPAPEITVNEAKPRGVIPNFEMSSADSKMYPGIARDAGTFGTPDPADPAKPSVTTSHPAPYTSRVAVHVPKQYGAGTIALFIVGTNGPDPLQFTALDNLITHKKCQR